MNTDPKLRALATKLGQLVQAYAGDSLKNGHAMLEIVEAFQAGFDGEHRTGVRVEFPLVPLGETPEYDINSRFRLRMDFHPTLVEIEKLPAPYSGLPLGVHGPNNDYVQLEMFPTHLRLKTVNRYGQMETSQQLSPQG